MRKYLLSIVFVLLVCPSTMGDAGPPPSPPEPVGEEVKSDPLQLFMDEIAFLESSDRYNVVNRFGMMGRYQFAPSTVEYLGFDVTPEEFLSNPALQDSVMVAYLTVNRQTLGPYLDEYGGTTIRGVYITEGSLLAGAHFAGAMGVVRFLTTDHPEVVDANGTTLSRYMAKFAEHELDL